MEAHEDGTKSPVPVPLPVVTIPDDQSSNTSIDNLHNVNKRM
jgi:hypothetical protein